jgi:hypothetical protein
MVYIYIEVITMQNEGDTLIATASIAPDEFGALQAVIAALRPIPRDAQQRIIDSTVTFLGLSAGNRPQNIVSERAFASTNQTYGQAPAFSEDRSMSPKEFVLEKQPRTDVERMACLAYYLTHYRDTPHFKTLDLSKLNTEAAQPKFANAANTANNAVKTGYLVPSTKGHRQLSAGGERFVLALPDRDAAKSAMSMVKPRRRSTRVKLSPEDAE